MSQASDIIAKITALGLFSKVRYLVAEADPDSEPTVLPICVLSDGGQDFDGMQTFCGLNDLSIQNYVLTILADTSSEVDSLLNAVQNTLIGTISLDSLTREYDPDLRAYSVESLWS